MKFTTCLFCGGVIAFSQTAAVAAGSALAADQPKGAASAPQPSSRYLERIESPVYETEGDHQAITKRAIICVAQIIKPGFITAPTIISSDPEAGVIVANNSFDFNWGLGGMIRETARSTLTFQAKDGKFRLVDTDIESLDSDPRHSTSGWQRVGTWKYGISKQVEAGTKRVFDALSACITAKNPTNDSW